MFALESSCDELYVPANEVPQRLSLLSINGFVDLQCQGDGPILVGRGIGHEVVNINLSSVMARVIACMGRRAAEAKRQKRAGEDYEDNSLWQHRGITSGSIINVPNGLAAGARRQRHPKRNIDAVPEEVD
jgi:hypothetical protein